MGRAPRVLTGHRWMWGGCYEGCGQGTRGVRRVLGDVRVVISVPLSVLNE